MSSHPEIPGLMYDAAAWPDAPAIYRDGLSGLVRRVALGGAAAIDDVQALAWIGGAPEANTLRLMAEFGSLPQTLGATFGELARIVPPEAAARLVVAQDMSRRLLERPLRDRPVLTSWAAVVAYLKVALRGAPREQFRVLFLDRKNQLIRDEVMGHGTVDHAPVYPREVLRRALELNASSLVLAHNHPSGDATPSGADIAMTRQVVEAAKALGVAVHDHVVVGADEPVSFKSLGLL